MTVTKIWHVAVFKAVFKHDVWSRLDIVCLRYNNIPFHAITKRDVWGRFLVIVKRYGYSMDVIWTLYIHRVFIIM